MVMHRWQGYDHKQLHDMINGGPGPSASTPQTEYWDNLNSELAQIDADLNAKLGTLQAAWEGSAGEQAHAGLTPLQQWATDAQSGATGMRASTEYQADMIARARAEMPEPVEVTTPAPSAWDVAGAGLGMAVGLPGPAMDVALQAADHEAQEQAQSAASQKAVDTMDSYQSSSSFNTATLGEFVPPPDVVISTPEPSGGTNYAASSFSSGFGGTGHTPTYTTTDHSVGNVGVGGKPAQFHPGGTDFQGGHQVSWDQGNGQVKPGTFNPVTGGGTTPSSFTPVQSAHLDPNLHNFNNQFTNNPGSPNFNQSPSAGQFQGQLGVPVSGAEGGRVLGGPGGGGSGGGANGLGGTGATAGNEAAKGQLGRGGMSGAGGMGAGENVMGTRGGAAAGAGRGGLGGPMGSNGQQNGENDEEEFESATYLVETDDVFGDERRVSQAVLGADE
ncbi:PPE domain-containing protein [Actinokineospora auranticolor]|uniref:PPE family protein n=1 Tax=Actinokineospora auranticolor TaxID=155976 RepID=A0A2S6GRJ8_9PSEU|nr:PPE domain-containing protein [Actinokineospora auranticolor]PPK67819.1 PPE family protein [Actinokineospora auranticolor]